MKYPCNYIVLIAWSLQSVEIKEDNGTSNITCADEDGLVISITTTIGLNFGSQIMVPEYGFILNDSMDDFSVEGRPNGTGYEPSPANFGAYHYTLNDVFRRLTRLKSWEGSGRYLPAVLISSRMQMGKWSLLAEQRAAALSFRQTPRWSGMLS